MPKQRVCQNFKPVAKKTVIKTCYRQTLEAITVHSSLLGAENQSSRWAENGTVDEEIIAVVLI